MPKLIDLTGQKFGRLTVLRSQHNDRGVLVWVCRCECGQETKVEGYTIRQKIVQSCGCLQRELASAKRGVRHANFRHGAAHTPEYAAYIAAKGRCNDPKNRDFNDYGGRGIGFHFAAFEEFILCVGPRPSIAHSLDRYPDNNGHYESGNLRWATQKQQVNNRRIRRIENFSDAELVAEIRRRGL